MVEVIAMPTGNRITRRPQHSFHIRHEPWHIQPCLIAPVLPGETMKNMLFQARVVSDPVKNPLIGWHYEIFIFYVKHRDLDGRDDFAAMVLDVDSSLSVGYDRAADAYTYHAGQGSSTTGEGIDWTWECLKRVVDTYFRKEGEDYTDHQLNNQPTAAIRGNSWMDSLVDATVFDEGGSPHDGTETLHELSIMQQQYEFLKATNLVNMTYEDFLATYGVKPRGEDLNEPELIRYVRSWSYPSNTIDPSDGSPTSALSWSISERADKDRFFREPGFIFGCAVARPKVYLQNQIGAGVSLMRRAIEWLPALLRDEPYTSLKELATGATTFTGPLGANPTNGYWADIRDLLLYGDQFVGNMLLSATDANLVTLPTAALEKEFASEADIDELFVTPAGPGNLVRADGIFSFNILGTQIDMT